MPWRPSSPGEVPTLGNEVIEWIEDNLAAPDRGSYEPFVLYPEQANFVMRFYELDPKTGRRKYRRATLSRPRGWGKSPFLAALAIAEALGPVVPDGWDAEGQPTGKPWTEVRTPLVQIAAVSETQTKNTWSPLLEMIREGPLADLPGLEPLDTFVNLPRGRIEPITSAARTIKGNRAVFAVLDQTEEWVRSNNGLRLAETMRINAAKVGGATIETPNAYIPGEGSVAEESAAYWAAIREGKDLDPGFYWDHREAPADIDIWDHKSRMSGLLFAYGDSASPIGGHVDLDVISSNFDDPAIDPQRARADFLNQITHASDSWISHLEWQACLDAGKTIERGDPVVLGFDGSRRRSRHTADATALIGCRVSDGHVFQLRVWEQPEGPAGNDWEVPTAEVDAEVRSAFSSYNVVGFYADPSLWESYVAQWEAEYGPKLQVKMTASHPIEWWFSSAKTHTALEQFHAAVVDREMTHDGAGALTRHMLNARRRVKGNYLQIAKEHKHSPRKIDAAVAAMLAWQARLDAVAKLINKPRGWAGRIY
jgi:phage terminase large subunit-like protein